jgi:hypothetical protein
MRGVKIGLRRSYKRIKVLKLKPYRTAVVCQLLPADAEARINYCRLFRQPVCDGKVDSDLVFYTDEVRFHLSDYVHSQNNRCWSAENPHSVHEVSIHDVKFWEW